MPIQRVDLIRSRDLEGQVWRWRKWSGVAVMAWGLGFSGFKVKFGHSLASHSILQTIN